MKIIYKTHFDAAHWLPKYVGNCHQLHGHTWKIVVILNFEYELPSSGMYVDFKDLKIFVNKIIDKLDHSCLNIEIQNPTAENIANWLFAEFRKVIKTVTQVQVWESENCGVEVGI